MIATHHDSPFVAGCLESLEAWLWGASDEELTTFHAFQEFLIRLVWSFRGKYRDYKTKLLLVGGWASPLKNMSSSIGMISNPIFLGNKIDGNQTTNQQSTLEFHGIFHMDYYTPILNHMDVHGFYKTKLLECNNPYEKSHEVFTLHHPGMMFLWRLTHC